MSTRSFLSFFAALLVGVSGACHALPSPEAAPHLRVGETLTVRLTASPATGFAWTFVGPLPPSLRMERDPGLVPFDRAQAGAGPVQAWTFRATRPGRSVLRFVYRRTWEPDATAAQRREIEVVVD